MGVAPDSTRVITVYDSQGRDYVNINALGNRVTAVYDAMGRTAATIDLRGNRTTTSFDSYGRVVRKQRGRSWFQGANPARDSPVGTENVDVWYPFGQGTAGWAGSREVRGGASRPGGCRVRGRDRGGWVAAIQGIESAQNWKSEADGRDLARRKAWHAIAPRSRRDRAWPFLTNWRTGKCARRPRADR